MLHIDSLLLDEFYKENKDFFINARVQKIQQPTRRDVILFLRNNGLTKKFYININPNFYHLCFMNKKNEEKRSIEIPKHPPMFCMLLRKHMEGAKILKIEKPDFERIIELTFENYNELGDRIEECLSIELMGKHSNIILYNTDNNIIIGCAHNIGAEKSKERELAGGLPYIYPPKRNKKDLTKTKYNSFLSVLKKSEDPIRKTIAENYFSLSQAIVEEICIKQQINPQKTAIDIEETEAQQLFVFLHEFLSAEHRIYSADRLYTKYSCLNLLDKEYQSVNDLIDDYFAYNIEKEEIVSIKASLKSKFEKELKKLQNTCRNQQKQINKKDKAQIYMTKGNLLTANSYNIKTGERNVLLQNYDTGEYIEIELDENLSAIENAKKYFELYNKNKTAYQVAEKMIEQTKEEIEYLNQLLFDVEINNSIKELKEISAEQNTDESYSKHKNKANKANLAALTNEEIDGYLIYIGKNSKQNDYLYSKVSAPDDLWFHVLNTPGSHVIVKLGNSSKEVPDNLILKAARLAKEYSTARNSSKTAVIYTKRKYIKRPNNTKSGFVVYKNETEIVVD